MLDSFLNLFNQPKSNKVNTEDEERLLILGGILVETASIDGNIDESEISKIKQSLINFFEINEEKSNYIVNKSLEKANEPNSLYYFTSKINKEFVYNKKIQLLEILWEIILADGKIHDFESNLIRRLSGLLYISDVDCGNVKKRISEKIKINETK